MLRVLIGALLSAIVLFVWGFVYWAGSPLPFLVLKELPNDAEVLAALEKGKLESGVYLSPWFNEEKAKASGKEAMMKEVEEREKKGPIVQIVYRKDGVDPTNPLLFALGFGHFFVSCLLLAVLLRMALPGLQTFGARWLFVFLAGLFASLAIDLSPPIWMHHPLDYPLFNFVYHLGFGLLGGLVLAAIIRPRPA